MSLATLPSTVRAFARFAFTDLLAYRLRYVVGILNYTIYMSVQFFLWSAVFASTPTGTTALGGFRFPELVTYFAVGWIVRVSYFNNIDRDLAERVTSGDIASDLLRPVSLMECYYGRAVGEASFRVLFMGIPTAAVLFPLYSVSGPGWGTGWSTVLTGALAFLAAVLLAFHAFFLINYIVGVSAVFFERIRGLLWAKFIVLQFLSGLLVPFDLFPGWARSILEALPFRTIVYSPVMIYLGRFDGTRLLMELAIQLVWVVALFALAGWIWSRCRRKLLVMGG